MKIALFGATGMIGSRILREALSRGHTVTAVVRDPAKISEQHPNLTVVSGDLLSAASISQAAAGHDAVVSAFGPGATGEYSKVADVATALLTGIGQAKVTRLAVVGGAGSLEVAPGVRLIDTPQFPDGWKGIAQAHVDALAIYRANATADWTFFSPPALIQPGERTGSYRSGANNLIADAAGQSQISAEDYAVALIDELERPQYVRQQMTAAY